MIGNEHYADLECGRTALDERLQALRGAISCITLPPQTALTETAADKLGDTLGALEEAISECEMMANFAANRCKNLVHAWTRSATENVERL